MGSVLIIDDTPLIRVQLRGMLHLAGVEVKEAVDGESGWDLLNSGARFDLVLCDVNMPGISGLDLLRKAHTKGLTRSTAFVMVTTEKKAALLEEAKANGARGWLVKPAKPDRLQMYLDRFVSGDGK